MHSQLRKRIQKGGWIVAIAVLSTQQSVFESKLNAAPIAPELGVVANPIAGGFEVTYFGFDGSPVENTDELEVVEAFFSKLGEATFTTFSVDEVPSGLKVIGKPLNYPNPFKLETGTEIGVLLNQVEDFEIQVYNMLGQKVAEKIVSTPEITAVSTTADGTYCRVRLTQGDLRGEISAGAYFYVLLKDKRVIGKGKMAILP